MDRFAALGAFTAVIETGSFQAAAQRLGITKSVVSRRVSQLEQSLQCRLLHRTTRRLSLTEEGRQFYQRAVQILSDLRDAELETTHKSLDVRGRLKLAAPLSFGLQHLSEAINQFMIQYPLIELELDLNDRNINLVEEGFDMAVRIGQLEDSSLVARRIGSSRTLTCASRAYLDEFGYPETPEQLEQHIGLQYSNISYVDQWHYRDKSGKDRQGKPEIRIRSNNGETLARSAASGLGIVSAPSFILGDFITTGALIPILESYERPVLGIYALYPPGRLIPARVKVLTDFLATHFGDQPYWDKALVNFFPG